MTAPRPAPAVAGGAAEPPAHPVAAHPVTDRVREAMAVTRRGCEELLPEADWLRKLARAEATGQPLRIKLGLEIAIASRTRSVIGCGAAAGAVWVSDI